MQKRTRITITCFAGAVILLVSFFGISVYRLIRESQEADTTRLVPWFPSGAKLAMLLPPGVSGPVTQDLVELDGLPGKELVIGYALREREEILPRLRAFRMVDNAWNIISEFRFLVDPWMYQNADEWNRLSGVPSFERKDINGNGQEELFVRLDSGNQFFRAIGIVIWNGEDLAWAPFYNRDEMLILPLFPEGGTATEVRRLFAEDASGGGGLDIVAGYGTIDEKTGIERWRYEIYVERNDAYRFDAALSEAYTAAGKPPGGAYN